MTDTPYLYRHSLDPNLWIYNGYYYNGMPVIWQCGPFIYNYLQRIDETIQGALQDHSNIIAIRVDLRLPSQFNWRNPPFQRPIFSRFTASLKAKIRRRQIDTERNGKRFHRTKLHYVWTREFGRSSGRPHFHCVLFLNKQTFRGLGEFHPDSQSLFGMISSAWASALGMETATTNGLVSVPKKKQMYWLNRHERYDDLFYRLSYFAKLESKQFGLASHNFGTSRTPSHWHNEFCEAALSTADREPEPTATDAAIEHSVTSRQYHL